jgi:hypothetical protein
MLLFARLRQARAGAGAFLVLIFSLTKPANQLKLKRVFFAGAAGTGVRTDAAPGSRLH